MGLRWSASALALGVVLVACSGGGQSAPAMSLELRPLTRALGASAAKANVPRDLLVAIAAVEDGLQIPAQRTDLHPDAAVPAAGPLMLRHGKLDTLARGAALVDASEMDLRGNADLALEAGALVLAELGAQRGASLGDLVSWRSAIEEMSGYADDAHRNDYVHRVFATLARGGRFEGRDGETILLDPHDIPPSLTLDVSLALHTLSSVQYPGAQWVPTSCANKCNPDRGGATVEYIVIHDTEGGWDASLSTLQNDSGKSVQYMVGTDGKVAQFVTEETDAWHAGNSWFNARSVGIEHVGYANKPYTEAQYAASAKLVDYLGTKYGVARDRAHIVGHDQVPDPNLLPSSSAACSDSPKTCEASASYGGASNHRDPGIWEWATYMARIKGAAKCNDVTALWNCSNDKTEAFRCASSKVEVLTCDGAGGCEVKPNGQDDVCNVSPKNTTPPVSNTVAPPAGAAPNGNADLGQPSGDSSGGAGGGCSLASPSAGAAAPTGIFSSLVLALTALLGRRRRRSRRAA